MKKILNLSVSIALLVAAPLAAKATTFFSDTFGGSGSTLTNLTPAAPTTSSTAYQLSSSKSVTSTNTLPGFLRYGINSTTSGGVEAQALFTTSPVSLAQVGDYIQLTVTFTNNSGLLTASCLFGLGLYNGGQVQPIAGGVINNALNSSLDHITGGVQLWQGYWGQTAFNGGNNRILNRASQTTGADNRTQNLTSTGSGSQSYGAPGGATVGANSPSTVILTNGGTYTAVLQVTLTAANTLAITNILYNGPDTNSTPITQYGGVASGATFLTSTFDGFALGWRATAATTGGTVIDISSIKVDGVSTAVSTPPDITSQPVPVSVSSGGSCIFSVTTVGSGQTYQWHRYGTNISTGGNLLVTTAADANSSTLTVSPVSAVDVATGANGYYVTVTGTGGFTTNSSKADLTLRTAKDLTWTGSGGNVWDLATTVSWQDPLLNASDFNYGDSVTFDDTASLRVITLTGKYLSASSVTVNGNDFGAPYNFLSTSTGGFAGPGKLIYKGANQLTIGNVNTHSGGTVISNAAAYLVLQNYNGLGSGPVTLAKAGGQMEITTSGSASVGIQGDVIVADDFAIQFDGSGTFSGVILGNLSGTAGKTLTLNPNPINTTTNQRVRIYGVNTTYNANLNLNSSLISMAPYLPSGSQIYNGVISGPGNLVQRGSGTTILNGQNTFSGGAITTTGGIGFGTDSTPTTGTVTSGPIGTGPLFIAPEVGSANGSGTVLAFGGARTIANPLQYPSATNSQILIAGGTNALTFTGPYTLNGNDGLGTPTNRVFQVNNTNTLTTISGVISDGGLGFGFVKTGNGILDITAAETYTGNTAVTNGTLRVNGSLNAASTVTVATNATLGGTGTIGGNVNVLAGGIIAPGNSVGTLNISGNLTLSGNLSIEVNRAGLLSDKTIVNGTLSNAGTGRVTVTNTGSTLLVGDKFFLFNKAVTGGSALTVTGGGVYWQNDLAVDGSITVHQLPSITSVVPGVSDITLNGANGVSGGSYVVLASTNVTAALSTWTRIQTNTFGGGGSFTATIPVSASIPARFFTLQLP